MGNVQSETTQESESAKEGEEKANPDRSKPPDRSPRSGKHEAGSRSPGPRVLPPQTAGQPLSSEPGGGDRPPGTPEMGKNHSKKSKLKLSSMWTQNLASGGMKEASLCENDPGVEKRGLACLSRADLPGRQAAALQEELKGPKGVLRTPQAGAERDLGPKRPLARGRSKTESGALDQEVGGPPQRPSEPPPTGKGGGLGRGASAPKDGAETEISRGPHARASAKDCSEKGGRLAEPPSSAKKPAPGASQGSTEPPKVTKEPPPASRGLEESNASKPALSGAKKALLSWGSAGPKEKETARRRDGTPGCDGDTRGRAFAPPPPPPSLPAEPAEPSAGPAGKPPGSEREGRAGGGASGAKDEAPGPEAVSSETMHELLEKGINFLCKVTIQPGVKAAKPKPTVLSPGVSYADILKQGPQKKALAGPPGRGPKAPHHLGGPGKKPPAFKGLEESRPEEFSLSQLFLEHFAEAAPKEPPAGHAPSQHVVTFFEELSVAAGAAGAGSPKGTDWQRPRPPTPYPQRRKGQGRKLPRFGTAVSQVVAFLGSNPKGDWFVQDEGQGPPSEAAVAAAAAAAGEDDGIGGGGHAASPAGGAVQVPEGVGFFQPVLSLFSEQEIPMEIDGPPLRPPRRPACREEGAKETSPSKAAAPCSTSRAVLGPLAAAQSLRKDKATQVQLLRPVPRSLREAPEGPGPAPAAPTPAPAGPTPDPKGPAAPQARPKARKPGPSAPKSKEKLKTSGQSKAKAPKGKGHKQWARGYGAPPALRLEGAPLFPPFEKVARPFYFGEPLETPVSLDKPAGVDADAASAQASPKDREAEEPPAHHWPAFEVSDSCPMQCYCKHQAQRRLPKNVVAWLNPSTNHLAEPPWVATAMLAVSLVAGTKFCLDSYKQQRVPNED